jgi:hypothetical protein
MGNMTTFRDLVLTHAVRKITRLNLRVSFMMLGFSTARLHRRSSISAAGWELLPPFAPLGVAPRGAPRTSLGVAPRTTKGRSVRVSVFVLRSFL